MNPNQETAYNKPCHVAEDSLDSAFYHRCNEKYSVGITLNVGME